MTMESSMRVERLLRSRRANVLGRSILATGFTGSKAQSPPQRPFQPRTHPIDVAPGPVPLAASPTVEQPGRAATHRLGNLTRRLFGSARFERVVAGRTAAEG